MRTTLPSGTPLEVALPEGTPTRGVVLAPDIMGLRPLFDDWCARLAAENGWAVAAFEPFPNMDLPTVDDRFAAIGGLTREGLMTDAIAAADHLVEAAGVERVAVIGFCMGGMVTFFASTTQRFDRAAAFYGMIRLPEAWRGLDPRDPVDYMHELGCCPTLAVLGGKDSYTPPHDIADLATVPGVTLAEYPEAEHGFVHDDSRPTHRAADAADAWSKVKALLA